MNKTFNFLLLLISISLLINHSLANTNFIKKCCTTTSYPKLCYSTLSPYGSEIKNDRKKLATKALIVALTTARSTSQALVRLSKHRGLKPQEASALSDCTMAVSNSEAQLQRSIQEMSRASASGQKEMQASDVQTWTSTAMTYAGTCIESFSGSEMNGNVKLIVRRQVERLTQYTSIALALVNNSYGSKKNAHHGTTNP
ncbi:21 kDa protein-like [Silene latifolia]|uniref:21 kDa protein-like n=1 Tax=Silene latifolia TaxID=37657 RepID=UPI003D77CBF0